MRIKPPKGTAFIPAFNKAVDDRADLFPALGGEKISNFHFLIEDWYQPQTAFQGELQDALICSLQGPLGHKMWMGREKMRFLRLSAAKYGRQPAGGFSKEVAGRIDMQLARPPRPQNVDGARKDAVFAAFSRKMRAAARKRLFRGSCKIRFAAPRSS